MKPQRMRLGPMKPGQTTLGRMKPGQMTPGRTTQAQLRQKGGRWARQRWHRCRQQSFARLLKKWDLANDVTGQVLPGEGHIPAASAAEQAALTQGVICAVKPVLAQ